MHCFQWGSREDKDWTGFIFFWWGLVSKEFFSGAVVFAQISGQIISITVKTVSDMIHFDVKR